MNPTVQLLEPEVVELVRAGRFGELRESLRGIDHADVAEILAAIEPKDAAIAFRFLPRDFAGEVFAHLDWERQQELIEELGTESSVHVIEAMDHDDRVALLDELPTEVAHRLIAALSPEDRRITQAILGYPSESVGRLMTPDYVRVRPDWSVQRAMEHIRKHGRDAATLHWVYVVDEQGRLVDDLKIATLLLADPHASVESLMDKNFIALSCGADQEEAVREFAHYDRTALPVIDSRGVLLGVVTVDDVADVAEEEATEDIQKLAGMEALDAPYMQATLREMVRKRGFWLGVLLIAESATILVMMSFQEKLAEALVLSLFVPLIIASGGNSGSQASSLVIRALALEEIEPRAWARVLKRELVMGLALGSILGVLAVGIVVFWQFVGLHDEESRFDPFVVGFAIGTAIVGCVLWGTLLGSMFPLLLKRVGLDPATASSPLVATIMDSSGLLIYFTIASVMLL
ncbi:MAG: magnesium transporter [Phycisphaerales bacterium]|jgi:magnesium transporter|nr:magnesium transporter [Phycisphaerales bacterium]